MREIVFEKEGVLGSYPYRFEIYKENETYIGIVTNYLYDQMVFENDEQRMQLQNALNQLEVQEQCRYVIESDTLIYQSYQEVDINEDKYAMEVRIRRHFMEDFIETDDDVQKLIKPFQPHTLKTEFVI